MRCRAGEGALQVSGGMELNTIKAWVLEIPWARNMFGSSSCSDLERIRIVSRD